MTTTHQFQNNPDYFFDKEECIVKSKEKKQTNSRYKNFTQNNFTAGDEEQFQEYRDPTNGNGCSEDISLEGNIFANESILDSWDKYKNVGADAVINTFRYIFNKFKKGIFIKIKDNKLDVFLPFSKASFTNEWSDKIKVDPKKYKTHKDFIKYVTELSGYNFNPRRVNDNIDAWYGNNCLIRYEFPLSEGDSNVGNLKNMLEELCAARKVPDIELFVNRRDFPLLTRDGTEAYDNIWGSDKIPLVSHSYDKYIPILSMSTSSRYADVTIPTWEDWARVQSKEGIYFPKTCRSYDETFELNWENKKPTAVFRGGTTGCGVTIETNPRLKAAYMSSLGRVDEDGIPFLDAGISNWNVRPRKIKNDEFLQTIEVKNLPFELAGRLSPEEQSHYKYILHIEGHVEAFRLSLELSMGSVVLIVDSQWKLWYSSMLVPYKHFVPVKSDMSDLIDQIKWCKSHDSECKEIAKNALVFFNTFLNKKGVLDYVQKKLVNLKEEMGTYLYNTESPRDIMLKDEQKLIDVSMSKYPGKQDMMKVYKLPNVGRSHTLLQGIQWAVNRVTMNSTFEKEAEHMGEIFSNKLGVINVMRMAGFDFAVKTTKDPKKSKEHAHETFVGLYGTNNVLKHIPNFAYIFGSYKGNDGSYNVITEHIKGVTLFDYIKGKDFNFNDFVFILVQLSLAIKVAQNTCGFVHYDLTPWNVMLQFTPKPINFNYMISHDNVIKISTKIIPVIIDYGKSHIVYNGLHHGFINMFNASTVQDIFSMLVTSIYSLNRLPPNEFTQSFQIANFMTGNKYRRDKFSSAADLRNFLNFSKKYENLISLDKYELEELGPMDLVRHILNIIPFSGRISVVDTYNDYMTKGNSMQIYDYIFAGSEKDAIASYTNVFYNTKSCSLPQPNNILFTYFAAQTMSSSLMSLKNSMLSYLKRVNVDNTEYIQIADDVINFIDTVYTDKISSMSAKEVDYNVSVSKLEQAKYNEETFLDPKKIQSMLEPKGGPLLSEHKIQIEYVLVNSGKYKVNDEMRSYYLSNLGKLLAADNFAMMNNFANRESLRVIAKNIYEKDLETQLSSDICINQKYMEEYKSILSQLL